MTNKDKFLKENVDPSNLIEAFIKYYYKHKREESDTGKAFVKYMNEEAKPKLTEDEKVILRNIPEDYKTIGKCKNGILYVTTDRKIYLDKAFGAFFNHLFQFIKERRRIRDSRTIERRINNGLKI